MATIINYRSQAEKQSITNQQSSQGNRKTWDNGINTMNFDLQLPDAPKDSLTRPAVDELVRVQYADENNIQLIA